MKEKETGVNDVADRRFGTPAGRGRWKSDLLLTLCLVPITDRQPAFSSKKKYNIIASGLLYTFPELNTV